MSTPVSPSDSDPLAHGAPEQNQTAAAGSQAAPPEHHKKPWGWIAVAAVLAAGIVGLGLYALNLDASSS